MKDLIKVMLVEGLDIDTIYQVLDVIKEKYPDTPEQRRKNLYNAERKYVRASQAREVNDDLISDILAHDYDDEDGSVEKARRDGIKAEYKAQRGYERAKAKVDELNKK